MFKAVRDSLIGTGRRIAVAWRDLRSKGMVTLFLFEFTVVLLGVLTAQALSSWATSESETRKLHLELTRIRDETSAGVANAILWKAATPCLRQRVEFLVTEAGAKRPVPSDLLEKPWFASTRSFPLDNDLYRSLSAEIGSDKAWALARMSVTNNELAHFVDQASQTWYHFNRLDATFGMVSDADADAARNAGVELLWHLSKIEGSARNFLSDAEVLSPDFRRIPDGVFRPVTDCDMLWRERAVFADANRPPREQN